MRPKGEIREGEQGHKHKGLRMAGEEGERKHERRQSEVARAARLCEAAHKQQGQWKPHVHFEHGGLERRITGEVASIGEDERAERRRPWAQGERTEEEKKEKRKKQIMRADFGDEGLDGEIPPPLPAQDAKR